MGCVACAALPRRAQSAGATEEVLIAYWRSGLAARLRIPTEAVEVVVGPDGRIAHAMAWLDASAVQALLGEAPDGNS